MKRLLYIALTLALPLLSESFVDDFARMEIDPFVEAVGGNFAAQGDLFTRANPAAPAEEGGFLSHSSMFGGMVSVDHLAYNKSFGKWGGSFALSYMWGNGTPVTALPDPEDTASINNRPYIVEERSHHDLLLSPAVSYRLSDKLYLGSTLNLFYRKHIDESAIGGGLNLGIHAKPHERLSLGLLVRNLSTMPVSWSTGQTDLGLPSARAGMAFMLTRGESFELTLLSDGEYDIASESIDWGAGLRGDIGDTFSLMAGYSPQGFSAGAGLFWRSFGLGLSFVSSDKLDQSYRISLSYRR